MAGKGCKCADGSYRQSCCPGTKRSNKRRRKSSSNKTRRRDGGREGDPISVILDRLERRGKIYAYGSVIAGGLYGAALVTEYMADVQYVKGAYGYHLGHGSKGLSMMTAGGKAARARSATRMRRAQRFATAGRITRKVAVRGVPVLGAVLTAYDAYTVVDWAIGGRLPYGARDRR